MQVNRTDKRSNRVEGDRRRGIERAEESVRNVAGTPSTHKSTQVIGKSGRATPQSSLRL